MKTKISAEYPKYTIAIIAGQLVVGGAEQQLYLWLSHLDRRMFQPVVVTLHPERGDYWEKAIESMDIPLLRISRRKNRVARTIAIAWKLSPYKPDLIHGWHLFTSPYAGAVAKILGAKSLGSLRSSYQAFCNSPQEATLSLYLMDALMTNSLAVGEQLKTVRKRKNQKIYVVQNAVEDQVTDHLKMRKKVSRQLGISTAGIWIGSLGRLGRGKRFDLIMKALVLLREDVKDFHFLLIGDGPERARLENLTIDLGITQYVSFAGEIPEARAWLSALDIFCFASQDEGLPNAVMEAAIARVPIVSWRLPFIEELLNDRESALLADPEDLIGFKDALLKLIESPELRIKMGNSGRSRIIDQFSLERNIQEMSRVYDQLLSI